MIYTETFFVGMKLCKFRKKSVHPQRLHKAPSLNNPKQYSVKTKDAKAIHNTSNVAIIAAFVPYIFSIKVLTIKSEFIACCQGITPTILTFMHKYKMATPKMEMKMLRGIFRCGSFISPPK